jgi:Kef-type K+ transport system membrane component KefB
MWFYTALIIATAILGKFGGSSIAARYTGMPWREASALGVLVNTRGLMELVLLNIGLSVGIISSTLFSMLVIMAILTTVMTAPTLEWIYFSRMFPKGYEAPDSTTVEINAQAPQGKFTPSEVETVPEEPDDLIKVSNI